MTEVTTSLGRIRGSDARLPGVHAFKGIPYAQAPVGSNQFKPPRPSVRDDPASAERRLWDERPDRILGV